MRNERLELLYRTIIKEHSNSPSNKRIMENPTGEFQLLNPSCGDQVAVQYRLEDDILIDVCFEGQGCAISIASASMMTELLQGTSQTEAQFLIDTFYELVKGNTEIDTKPLKDALYLQGVTKFPMRIRCATLAWHALEQGLQEYEKEDL